MTALARPDVAFKTWLYNNWNCAIAGALKADIDFQNNDWTRIQIQTGRPIIVVKNAGFRQMEDEEKTLYEFMFLVEVGIHTPSEAETDAKRTLQWVILTYLKSLVDAFTSSSITGWQYVTFSMGANIDVAIALPEDIVSDVTIKACVGWTTS